MASDNRAAKRRAARPKSASEKAKSNGRVASEEEGQVTAPEATEQVQNGVFIAIARTPDEGIAQIIPVPQGDVRAAEMLTIMEKGVKVLRASLNLD
jgi:hypothetical protein